MLIMFRFLTKSQIFFPPIIIIVIAFGVWSGLSKLCSCIEYLLVPHTTLVFVIQSVSRHLWTWLQLDCHGCRQSAANSQLTSHLFFSSVPLETHAAFFVLFDSPFQCLRLSHTRATVSITFHLAFDFYIYLISRLFVNSRICSKRYFFLMTFVKHTHS